MSKATATAINPTTGYTAAAHHLHQDISTITLPNLNCNTTRTTTQPWYVDTILYWLAEGGRRFEPRIPSDLSADSWVTDFLVSP